MSATTSEIEEQILKEAAGSIHERIVPFLEALQPGEHLSPLGERFVEFIVQGIARDYLLLFTTKEMWEDKVKERVP